MYWWHTPSCLHQTYKHEHLLRGSHDTIALKPALAATICIKVMEPVPPQRSEAHSRSRQVAEAHDDGAQGTGQGEPSVNVRGPHAAHAGPGSADVGASRYRKNAVGNYKFEYLDHTADVQLHAWGATLNEAFEQAALAMFNYMTPLEAMQPLQARKYRAEGHDLESLLYAFLDELLFVFHIERLVCVDLTITRMDLEAFVIEAEGKGETFDRARHETGTEVKAITYSAMNIIQNVDDAEVFVIVDI